MNQEVNLFDPNKPTQDNIECALKNILYYINACKHYEVYVNYQKEFDRIIEKIMKIFYVYINNKNLYLINDNEILDIRQDIIVLDQETKMLPSDYTEWAINWVDALNELRIAQKKEMEEQK